MYGYIRPMERELKIRESEYYRAVYCAICRKLGEMLGQRARLTLSYDAVFLATLRAAVTGNEPQLSHIRCALHPLQQGRMAADGDNDAIFCAAAVSALLACGKVRDDIADERGGRRLRARAAWVVLSAADRRATDVAECAAKCIKDGLWQLENAERECALPDNASIDRPASLFGRMMADAVTADLSGEAKMIVGSVARAAGHWLYCIDAIDDMAEDEKRGRFNPMTLLYGRPYLTKAEGATLSCALGAELDGAAAALDLISPAARSTAPNSLAICENILKLGMPTACAKIIKKATKTENTAGAEDPQAPSGKE